MGYAAGERVDIETRDGEIILRRAVLHSTLEELFRGHNPDEWRAVYEAAYDWGPDVGRAKVDD